jgi:general L-amino acid transport system permease protein
MIAAILAFLFTAVFFLFISNPLVSLLNFILPISLPFVESLKMGGFTLSLIVGVTGIVASFPIGILLALGRQSNLPVIKMICVGFIEFIRGVPLITLLFVASVLLNYFLPPGTNFDIVLRVVIMVTLFSAAYMAEVIRGGLAGLPLGQHEASASLGLTYWQSQRLIIMPQALKISIPGIVNTFIGLFKDTTLVSIISLRDPVGLASTIRADQKWNGIYWELYVAIGLMFFIFCWGMSQYSQYLERKLKTDK